MQRTLNWKAVLWSLGALLLVAVAVHGVHALQVRRNAGNLLARADRAKEAGDLDQALTYYSHYLAYEPGDSAALARYALILDGQARGPGALRRAVETFEQVLKGAPDQKDVRSRLVLDLVRLGRFGDAIANIQTLLLQADNKAELEHMLGWCREASGDYPQAAAAFRRAIALDAHRLESYVLLAEVLQNRLDKPEEAGKVIDNLVAANDRSARAYLIRFDYRRASARALTDAGALAAQAALLAGAESDLRQALDLGRNEPAVLLAAADWAQSTGDVKKARDWLEQGRELDPGNVAIVKALAGLEMRAGAKADAAAILTAALKDMPEAYELGVLLTDVLIDQGKLPDAALKIDELSEAGAPAALCDYLRARIAAQQASWTQALTLLKEARAALGSSPEWTGRVHALLGQCYQQLGDHDKAVGHYLDAVKLGDRDPRDLGRLTQLLVHFKRYLDAEQVLHGAEGQRPLPPELARLGADIALVNHNVPEALRLAARAVRPTSRDYRDHVWLGGIYHSAGLDPKAEEVLRQSVALAPDAPDTWIALAGQLARMGKHPAAQSIVLKAKETVPARLALYTQARCYQEMGLHDRAEAFYRQGLANDAGPDFIFLTHAADFHRHADQPEKAEPFLLALLKDDTAPAEYVIRGRRDLALILAAKESGNHAQALALIDENLRIRPNNAADLRARTLIQAIQPAQRRQAIEVFEQTAGRQPLSADEELQLARLYEADGDELRSREHLAHLLAAEPENPQFLAFYIRHLIKAEENHQAREQFEKLQQLEPDSRRTRELEARFADMDE